LAQFVDIPVVYGRSTLSNLAGDGGDLEVLHYEFSGLLPSRNLCIVLKCIIIIRIIIIIIIIIRIRISGSKVAGVAQSVQRLATGWTVRGSNPSGDEIFRTHPASYTVSTGSFLGVKRPGRGVDHPPHIALKLRKE
jgi:hypothetical protein